MARFKEQVQKLPPTASCPRNRTPTLPASVVPFPLLDQQIGANSEQIISRLSTYHAVLYLVERSVADRGCVLIPEEAQFRETFVEQS